MRPAPRLTVFALPRAPPQMRSSLSQEPLLFVTYHSRRQAPLPHPELNLSHAARAARLRALTAAVPRSERSLAAYRPLPPRVLLRRPRRQLLRLPQRCLERQRLRRDGASQRGQRRSLLGRRRLGRRRLAVRLGCRGLDARVSRFGES